MANKALYIARNKKESVRRADFLNNLKKGPCSDCGKTYPPCVMDFDHVKGEKIGNVGQMVLKEKLGRKKILEEIAKCELVCANCHRLRTCNRSHKKHAALVAQWKCAGPVNQ